MQIKNDFIVVAEINLERSTNSGLVMPTSTNELDTKVKYGKITDVSEEAFKKGFNHNDTIVFNKYYSMPFEDLNGKKLIAIPTKDVIGILEESSESVEESN